MTRTIVGVLRGGTGSEYDLSLKTGAAILSALPESRFETRDIFIDKAGLWHVRGIPSTPARALVQVDVVLNALHGGVGEDGTVQRLLHRAGVPFAGSAGLSAALSLNKIRARHILEKAGVHMPRAVTFSTPTDMTTAEMTRMVFSHFGPPYVVKPPSEGASHGIVLVQVLRDLPGAIGDALDRWGSTLVEEFVLGKQASVGIIEKFRSEQLYALPPAETFLPEGARILEPAHHSGGVLLHEVPSRFSHEQKNKLMDMARTAHRALELAHFSRADFIVGPRAIYLLEVNAIPGLYPGASFPPMLEAVGSSVLAFLEHSIALARR